MTKKLDDNLPSGDYIAGFVDGEGCFSLSFRKDVRHERKGSPVYYSWKILFAINLRADDHNLLRDILSVLKCGTISFTISKAQKNSSEEVRYQTTNIDELKEKIVPFFQKYKLYGKKKHDFTLWSEALDILQKYKSKRGKVNATKGKQGFEKTSWNEKDIKRLLEIKNEMARYKSKREVQKWLNKATKIGREL